MGHTHTSRTSSIGNLLHENRKVPSSSHTLHNHHHQKNDNPNIRLPSVTALCKRCSWGLQPGTALRYPTDHLPIGQRGKRGGPFGPEDHVVGAGRTPFREKALTGRVGYSPGRASPELLLHICQRHWQGHTWGRYPPLPS